MLVFVGITINRVHNSCKVPEITWIQEVDVTSWHSVVNKILVFSWFICKEMVRVKCASSCWSCQSSSPSVPPVGSLVVTELWLLFISSSQFLFFSKKFARLLVSSHFYSLYSLLITAQMSSSLTHSPRHSEQHFSNAVCVSVVNTSPKDFLTSFI